MLCQVLRLIPALKDFVFKALVYRFLSLFLLHSRGRAPAAATQFFLLCCTCDACLFVCDGPQNESGEVAIQKIVSLVVGQVIRV